MSSFVGHSLAALAISAKDRQRFSLIWLACLLLAAIAPDLDYLLHFLSKSQHAGIRISHSVGFAFVVPALVVTGLVCCGVRNCELRRRAWQVILAGQSHILLDFLVGVHPMPLIWPLADATFRCPIGLLPSAGALSLTNIYLYRNLALELGILLPICALFRMRRRIRRRVLPLALIALICLAISANLPR